MCATPLLTLSSSGNRRGQETQSSWAQNKRNSETIQRREPKPGLVNIHLIPPSRKSRESGAPESWWFHNETELKRLSHPSTHILGVARKNQNEIKSERKAAPPVFTWGGDFRFRVDPNHFQLAPAGTKPSPSMVKSCEEANAKR